MMVTILITLIFLCFILSILYIFASPRLSPIPYFPSHAQDIDKIINALRLENNQTVFDLGAGDGAVIFAAAHNAQQRGLNTQFYAIEINPILLGIMWLRLLRNPARSQIHIIKKDMFQFDYESAKSISGKNSVYLYVSPRFIPKVIAHLKKSFNDIELITYFYPPDRDTQPLINGINPIYRTILHNR